jgi:sulfur carrier protein
MITINGQSQTDIQAGQTVAAVLERLELSVDARGVAVAVDGEVIPRSAWTMFTLSEGARVEVLSAMQGG